MTVTAISPVKRIAGAGWVNPLTHTFLLENAAHLKVFADDAQLTLGVDYTVAGVGNPAGFSVTITTPGSWTPVTWVLEVQTPLTQEADLDQGSGGFALRFENALDAVVRRVQGVGELAGRSLRIRKTATVDEADLELVPEPGKALAWSVDGALTNINTLAQDVIDAEAAAAASAASAAASQGSADNAAAQAAAATAQAMLAAAQVPLAADQVDLAAAQVALAGGHADAAAASAADAAASAGSISFTKDNDGTMAANSNAVVPSQAAVVTYVAAAVAALRNGVSAAYDTLAELATGLTGHIANVANPHGVTKAQVGLGNVDNTSDATQNAAVATLTNKTLVDPVITGAILEDIYTIVDGAAFQIDPGNGSIQQVTLGANRTPAAANFANGESVTLMVDDGSAFTLTWTTIGVKWVGGTAPTLATTGWTVIELWKVGGSVYGAKTGEVAT